jgi:hypothetical protein
LAVRAPITDVLNTAGFFLRLENIGDKNRIGLDVIRRKGVSQIEYEFFYLQSGFAFVLWKRHKLDDPSVIVLVHEQDIQLGLNQGLSFLG